MSKNKRCLWFVKIILITSVYFWLRLIKAYAGSVLVIIYLVEFLMYSMFRQLLMVLVLVALAVPLIRVHQLPDKTTSICCAYSAKKADLFRPTVWIFMLQWNHGNRDLCNYCKSFINPHHIQYNLIKRTAVFNFQVIVTKYQKTTQF